MGRILEVRQHSAATKENGERDPVRIGGEFSELRFYAFPLLMYVGFWSAIAAP